LLDQLPKDTRVSELVEGINMTGVGSNIRFQDISVEPEIENEFFIEQPIRIAALGEYHQFGSFISGLAALPRIITMHDFEVSNPQPTLDVLPELNLVLQTKTYRSKEAVA
jgi:type IV pilus assembly protein PilO